MTGEVVKLLAVTPPAPAHAAIDRDLPFARAAHSGRKRLHIDLIPATLVGLVGHPLPIRREAWKVLVGRRLQERERLMITLQRQNPEVALHVVAEYCVRQKSTVLGPVAEEHTL